MVSSKPITYILSNTFQVATIGRKLLGQTRHTSIITDSTAYIIDCFKNMSVNDNVHT
jgi:hypothetical protein